MNITFSRKTDLAMTAIAKLAGVSGMTSRTQLAESVGTSPGYLAQVMAPLVRAG